MQQLAYKSVAHKPPRHKRKDCNYHRRSEIDNATCRCCYEVIVQLARVT